jgi:hypothetical protein
MEHKFFEKHPLPWEFGLDAYGRRVLVDGNKKTVVLEGDADLQALREMTLNLNRSTLRRLGGVKKTPDTCYYYIKNELNPEYTPLNNRTKLYKTYYGALRRANRLNYYHKEGPKNIYKVVQVNVEVKEKQ